MKHTIELNEPNQTLDQMIMPMMLTNEVNTPAYINRAFLSQVGYTLNEIPDHNSWLIKAYPNPDYREKVMENWDDAAAAASISDDASAHLLSKICCADGVSRWFEIHHHTIGTKHAVTFLNVDELKRQTEDLTEVAQQKETQLCIIAHDVRSPLSSIKQIVSGYEKINLSENDVEELFFRMNSQVDHVFNIVNSILIRNSDERGRFIPHHEPINLKSFFLKYPVFYKERLTNQDISLFLDLKDDTTINYDAGILDVICRNLLDNAIKFTGNNGAIHVSFKRLTGYAQLIISDTGPGMPAEQVAQMNGNQGNRKSPRNVTDGFGLGLLFAKELLEKYHGRLSVKSETGVGTSFIIDINDHFLN
ncbi:HAMP domain-containing histidine kinase [Mucilaginibacter sp. BJC16-A38]|uniref:sensor histidine kinase n=1 Tax=Mucilaginibacter phenanthrenivorans TaxID=1234842 RepID=UPI0021584DF1|nr:HAMP domain-containing sensor histidine kinase [Mucilaginibacter phenanthrenivorans]MCR8557776.1 HAMP domain-containing histidine kinase [Mucilaginibacter phenanthrenivorans]